MCICFQGKIRVPRKKTSIGIASNVTIGNFKMGEAKAYLLTNEEEVPCNKCRPNEYQAVMEAIELVEKINEASL